MAFDRSERLLIEATAGAFVARRRPAAHLLAKVDYGFRIVGQSVELYEIRPRFDDRTQKTQLGFAKATHVKSQGTWKVYWMRGNLKWYPYQPAKVRTFDEFVALVDEDKDNCFFG